MKYEVIGYNGWNCWVEYESNSYEDCENYIRENEYDLSDDEYYEIEEK